MLGQVDHGREDRCHGAGLNLVGDACGIQCARRVLGFPDPVDEILDEFLGIGDGVVEHLARQEAILGRQVPFDVNEGGDSIGVAVGEERRARFRIIHHYIPPILMHVVKVWIALAERPELT